MSPFVPEQHKFDATEPTCVSGPFGSMQRIRCSRCGLYAEERGKVPFCNSPTLLPDKASSAEFWRDSRTDPPPKDGSHIFGVWAETLPYLKPPVTFCGALSCQWHDKPGGWMPGLGAVRYEDPLFWAPCPPLPKEDEP